MRAPYANEDGSIPIAVFVCLYGITVVVAFASPFTVLPAKDSIEAMLEYKLSNNSVCTPTSCKILKLKGNLAQALRRPYSSNVELSGSFTVQNMTLHTVG